MVSGRAFLLSGRLHLESIVTHQIPLTEFEEGFRLMQSGEGIKIVMEVTHQEKLPCPTAN